MIRSGQSVVLPFSIALALMMPALPQTITTGEVTGTVLDATNAVVANVAVKFRNVDTGDVAESPSNELGIYRLTFAKPGNYEISAASTGLKSDVVRLLVAVGQVQVIDLHLTPAPTQQVIEVTDAAPLLDTDNANIVYTLSTRQLELLPIPGGDLASVAYAVPGVVVNNAHTGSGGSFAAAGIGGLSNLFTVNGTDEMNPYSNDHNSGTTGLLLGINEVQQTSVIQNPYEGQYGRQAGAQVNYVTKSGSNTYHGNLIYSYNGTPMNANDFFLNANGRPRHRTESNQYAASIGGYAIKNKLFFFADTEGLRFALPGSTAVASVPSVALQNYSLMTIQPSQVPIYQQMFSLYDHAPGYNRAVPISNGVGQLKDVNGKLGCGAFAGTPSPAGTFGVDISCADAWVTSTGNDTSEWLLSTRMDYNLSSRQRMYFRFRTDHGRLLNGNSLISPLFDVASTQPDYEGQADHTWTITPHLINDLIGAVTYNDYVFGPGDPSATLRALPFAVSFGPRVGLSGIGPPPAYPQGRRAGQFQLVENLSYQIGRHSFKAGLDYRYNRITDLNYHGILQGAAFSFRSLSGFSSGNVDGGSGSSFTQSFTPSPIIHLRLYNLGAYIQDQWTVTPGLKITASLRFDRTGNPDCVEHCFSQLIRPFPELDQSPSTPYNQSIQTGLSHAFYNIEPIVPQPRIGLAYTPGWSRATVIRGGVGLFSDLYASSFADLLAFNAPNAFSSSIGEGLVNTAAFAGSAPAIAAAAANAFQSQFASGATLAQLTQAVSPSTFIAPNYSSMPSTLRSPKYLEWSVDVERQVGAKNVLTLRYMGNHGYDIFVTDTNANAAASGFAGLPPVAPDPRFFYVFQFTNAGYSNYGALVTQFRHSFARGFQGQISYTWSHARDTVSNGGIVFSSFNYDSIQQQINPSNPGSLNYSNADYDVRHNLNADVVWEGPARIRNRLVNAVLGGWSLGGRVNAHSGLPFSVENASPSGAFGPILADILDTNLHTSCGASAVNTPCFSPNQFASSQNDFGNLPRNSFRGPGLFDVDSSLYKTVSLGERMRLAIGASAYNLLNHPNFATPDAFVGSSGLGLIGQTVAAPSSPYGSYGASSARVVVATGKLNF